MRYIAYRFKGEPTKESPVGMNNIVAMGRYQSPRNLMRYAGPSPANIEHMKKEGYTHIGIYKSPESYALEDVLVQVIALH